MKKLSIFILSITVFLGFFTSFAESASGQIFNGNSGSRFGAGSNGKIDSLQDVGIEILNIIENIIIPIVMGLALLTFLLGVVNFIKNGGKDEERTKGRQFMLWGIIGLAVMVSVWSLVRILTNTVGQPLTLPSLQQIDR
jgi:hypothetical protein